MMANPKPGQLVRVHYAKRYAHTMMLHGKVGRVVVVCKARKCRNHGVDIDGVMWVIPCGNLHKMKEEDMATATVSINGREMGELVELLANPTEEFKDAMGRLVTGALGSAPTEIAEPQPAYMTTADRAELGRHEAVIKRGLATFVEVANALVAIRDAKLYRGEFATFADYCRDRWDFGKSQVYRLISAAEVAGNLADLSPIGDISESVLRPLAKLAPDQQRVAYTTAIDDAGGKQPTAKQVEKAVERIRPPKPTPAPALAKPTYVEPTPEPEPLTPPDLAAAGYTLVRDGEAFGWIRTGDHEVDSFKQYPLNKVISHYRAGTPFDQVTAIEEARRDMIAGVKMGLHESYYPEKHGLAIMPADLVAAGYELVGGDGDDFPAGKRGYRWRFGDEMGPNVAYGGAAIEGARLHLQASVELKPADPIVTNLIEANTITMRFTDSLRIATVAQLEAAMEQAMIKEPDHRRYLKLANRRDLLKANAQADEAIAEHKSILNRMAAAAEAMPADDAPTADELAAIAIVEAEVVEEDEERAARDETRASYERAATAEEMQRSADEEVASWEMTEPTPEQERWQLEAEATIGDKYWDNASRLQHARRLRTALVIARDLSRQHYGDLTGHHTDMLEFERGVEKMLPRLDSLIDVLGGEKVG